MADAIGEQLRLLNVEAAAVTQQLANVDEELFGEKQPSGKRLQLLKEKPQRFVKQEELLNQRRGTLVAALAAGAPPCARACTLAVCEL
jgi:hypothetical protein